MGKSGPQPLPLNQKVYDEWIQHIESGLNINQAADKVAASLPTLLRWKETDESTIEKYARALRTKAEIKFAELEEISSGAHRTKDDRDTAGAVARDRLHSDNVKWALAKMHPERFSDKVGLVHSGEVTNKLDLSAVPTDLLEQLANHIPDQAED